MTVPQNENLITSIYATDAEMAELVELFVDELPDRIAAFAEALEAEHWETVRTISHQLKGAAPGYGFESVGEAAGKVERLVIDHASVDQTNEAARSFIALCGRVAKA